MTEQNGAPAMGAPADPRSFGRVADDGSVFLRLPDGSERKVGAWAVDGDVSKALDLYVNRYQDLATEIDLAAKRLANDRSTPAQATATVTRVRDALVEPAFVGDLAALVARVGQLEVLINVKKAAVADAKVKAREESAAKREALAAEAESLADSTAWRVTNDRFKELVEEWKAIPRARDGEDDLWKRISKSRSQFDRKRRAHYAQLEESRGQVKEAKTKLVKEAEKLSDSSDWAQTTAAYRKLLDEWKKAGRAGKDDEKLWNQFKAAQDAFFTRRNEVYGKRDEDEKAALAVKQELVGQAEALLPVKDFKSAKKALRPIQEKYEKAGRVPRGDVRRIDGRMKAVEDAIRNAERDNWKKTNPEFKARASSTVDRFSESVAKLERQLNRAKESGNAAAIKKAQDQLDGARQLLEVAEKGLTELS